MDASRVIVDGDIVAYRSAFSAQEDSPEDAIQKVDNLMQYILRETLIFPLVELSEVYLTGKGNFRNEIAKFAPYKGNRKHVEKPIYLYDARQHLIDKYGAVVSDGEEADDLIAIAATKYGKDAVVASVDKDMLQIPCKHFNFVKGTWTEVNEFDGLKFFYKQILTGDSADNIMGLYRVGPVKAEKMIEGCSTEEELWDAVLKAYDGDMERVVENARLLWLRRKEGEIWQPPTA